LIFISNLIFILFIVFCFFLYFSWLIFLISSLIIWFDFIFISILVLIIWFSFLFFFLIIFFYFFNSTPHYLAHDFFEFDFYGSIQPHDPCHEFKRLNRVEFGFFLSAYSFLFFSISSFNIVLVEDLYSILFTFISMYLSLSYIPNHRFSRITSVDLSLFFTLLFFKFYFFSHLQHLIHLRIKCHNFIWFTFHEVILVSWLGHKFSLLV